LATFQQYLKYCCELVESRPAWKAYICAPYQSFKFMCIEGDGTNELSTSRLAKYCCKAPNMIIMPVSGNYQLNFAHSIIPEAA
jgi:hypothetical protein